MSASSRSHWYRRKRTVVLLVLAINCIFLFYLFGTSRSFVTPPFEIGGTIEVVVVDEDGERIEGASVTPQGLRSVQERGSWHSWREEEHGPYESVSTNEKGLAELKYPKWVDRQSGLVISTLCMVVRHPDYCPENEVECETANVGRVKPVHRVQLKRGGRLKVSLRRENSEQPFGEVYGCTSGVWLDGRWKHDDPGMLVSPVYTPRSHVTRIIDQTDPLNLQFSDPIVFNAVAGKTEDVDAVIRPGARFRGRLDVPGPVNEGYVILRVIDFAVPIATKHDDALIWTTWTKVAENGEFEFRSLPPTTSVSLHAWCNGYVSCKPKRESIPPYALPVSASHVLPQYHELKDPDAIHVVPMEQSATCEARVIDSSGRPLQGIKLEFYPNILIGVNGNTLFGVATAAEQHVPKTFESVAEQLKEEMRRWSYRKKDESAPDELSVFHTAVSDADGKCLIPNIPTYHPETLYVVDEKWVMKGQERPPFNSRLKPTLTPGEVTKIDVVLVPKPALTPQMLRAPEPNVAQKILDGVKQFLGL